MIDVNVNRQGGEVPFHEGAYFFPVQAAVTAAEAREGNGGDAFEGVGAYEFSKPGFDILQLGGVAPMFFCREQEQPVVCFIEEHELTDGEGVVVASLLVPLEHVGIALFEGESESLAHDTDRVHGVDDDLGGTFENIAFYVLYHACSKMVR